MTGKDKIIREMMQKANAMLENGWSRDIENEIWQTASDYNSTHDDEIFMCEYQSDDSDFVNGFMIEDDYWTFN